MILLEESHRLIPAWKEVIPVSIETTLSTRTSFDYGLDILLYRNHLGINFFIARIAWSSYSESSEI